MSRTQISHRTVTTIPINVSQDHETPAHSSPPREEAVMKEDKGTDLVEDSFPKPDTVLKRASTVRPSQALQSDDDELYSLTPGRVATRALSLLERSNSKPEKGTRLSPLRRQSGQPSAQNMQQSRNMPPATSAMDALLSRGAVVHPPVGSSKQPTSKKRSSAMRADLEGDEIEDAGPSRRKSGGVSQALSTGNKITVYHEDDKDELQSFDDGISAPIGSHPRSSKKASKAIGPREGALKRPSVLPSIPGGSNATGSAAALLRRRGLQDAPTPSSTRSVLQPRDKNIQVPAASTTTATAGKTNAARSQKPFGDKISAVDRDTDAQSFPKASKRKDGPSKLIAKGKTAAPSSDDEVLTGSALRKARPSAVARGKQPLKRSIQARDSPTQDSTYDVPDSSNEDEDYSPTKKTRKTKAAAPAKSVAKSKSKAKSPELFVKKPAQKGKAKNNDDVSTAYAPVDPRTGPSTSTRGRMKAFSGVTAAPLISLSQANASLDGTSHMNKVQKPVEASEKEPQDAASGGLPPVDAVAVHRRSKSLSKDVLSHQPLVAQDTITIKKEKFSGMRNEQMLNQDSSRTVLGMSQQDAIVLSDGQITSDDSEEEAPVNVPAAKVVPGKTKERRPTTPAVLHSSPPIAARTSTRPTTASLATINTAKKSTIIGFDRSGPRNQGSMSARSTRHARVTASPNLMPPFGSKASSVARPAARETAAPPPPGKVSKAGQGDVSTAPSNIANSVSDALAGFRRKSVGQQDASQQVVSKESARNMARPNHHRRGQRQTEDYDDSFPDIDTVVDQDMTGAQGSRPQPLMDNPFNDTRTASQVQMPPPKARTTRQSNSRRAPTIPTMLEVMPAKAPTKLSTTLAAQSPHNAKRQRTSDEDVLAPKRIRIQEAPNPLSAPDLNSPDTSAEQIEVHRKRASPQPVTKPNRRHGLASRTVSRTKSLGNVDINGSPVPEGLVIGELDTALEVFSQQAGLPSDPAVTKNDEVMKKVTISSEEERVPSKAPGRVSSNTKVLPAEPSQESQAITHVVRLRSGQELRPAKTAQPSLDPFARVEQVDGKGSSSSAFSERLRAMAAKGPSVVNGKAPAEAEEVEDDPDKTLVEPSPCQNEPKHTMRVESFTSSTPSEASNDVGEDDSSMRDISIWRESLQPHQMNLFDELVGISHRLVRHLVDREQAATDVVDDYRRHGEQLIRQLELSLAEDRKTQLEALSGGKKRLQKDLEKISGSVADDRAGVKEDRREAKRMARSRRDAGQGLQDVMSTFC